MKTQWVVRKRWLALCLSSVLLVAVPVQAGDVGDAITAAADRLVDQQVIHGPATGTWSNEAEYTGSIVPGLISAYVVTGKDAYKTSAELAGDYITAAYQNYYGDMAYTLARLSQISADPNNNPWRDAVSDFYDLIRDDPCQGTAGYIAWYDTTNPSTAVFYLAHHLVAAHYVQANDVAIWRAGLIHFLSTVADNTADYPVLSLGLATWALAQTGPLDGNEVRDAPAGEPYWNNVTLADLPALLASHQVPEPDPYAGSFFWRFGHDDGDPQNVYPTSGYTEDATFAVLGLMAAAQAGASPDAGVAVQAAREILPSSVDGVGRVSEHIWLGGYLYNFYAGELLQALSAVSPAGDTDDDGCVDGLDFITFLDHWLEDSCAYSSWCGGADLDHDTVVNLVDFDMLAANLGKCAGE